MPGFLRQATAGQIRALGPFIDSTDFVSPLTGLTIANTDIKLVVNGGASANKNSGGGTHRVNGVYGVTFDATDTATIGEMEVSVKVAGALIVFDKFTVIEEAVYDLLYAASATGQVTVATNGIVAASFAVDTWPMFGIIDMGTAQSASATGLVLRSAAAFADDSIIGATALVSGGSAGVGQSRLVNDNALSGDSITVDTWAVTPTGTITYVLFGSAPASTAVLPSVNVTQIAGQTANAAGAVTFPGTLASTTNITAGTITTVTNLTNAPTSGDFTATMKTSIGTAVAASAVASVTGAVGSVTGSVGSVVGFTASDVAAIKAKTDALTFTATNYLNVDVRYVNTVLVNGDGSPGNPWGP